MSMPFKCKVHNLFHQSLIHSSKQEIPLIPQLAKWVPCMMLAKYKLYWEMLSVQDIFSGCNTLKLKDMTAGPCGLMISFCVNFIIVGGIRLSRSWPSSLSYMIWTLCQALSTLYFFPHYIFVKNFSLNLPGGGGLTLQMISLLGHWYTALIFSTLTVYKLWLTIKTCL